ncbi:MAG TPA: ABC transporter permease [Terriglobales bacterium]|nr:ABC transporter permease [Terriglobales bacterium]
MSTFFQDLRFALRQMWRSPGFSLTAILSLALGIGATVAVFSVIYGAVLNAWPYAEFDRACQINTVDKTGGNEGSPDLTGPQIRQLRQAHAVEDIVAMQGWNLVITGNDVPEDVSSLGMTGNGFRFFGMPAMLGRVFEPSDAPDDQDPQPVAVLSYKFWRRHFNSAPDIVGKNIQMDHKNYTILGVMPPRFTWSDADVYSPMKLSQDPTSLYWLRFRLKKGVSLEAAAAEFTPLFQQFDKEKPNYFPQQFRIIVRKTGDFYTHDLNGTLYLLFGAVALLLAISCGNVSILLLARGTARQHELAIRSAVGASRFRIVRQLLTESLLLAAVGAGLGILIAYRLLEFIVARLPQFSFPHEADFHVNVPVLLFSVGLAVASGVLFGIFPALESARREINEVIQSGTHRLAGSVRGRRVHTGLIAGQIALTLLLLTAAGAAIQGFTKMMQRPLGYDPHHVMSVGIPVHENTLTTWAKRVAYFAQLRERVASMPGVVSAGISSNATPPNNGWNQAFEILGKTAADHQEARANLVSSEYFGILRIPLVAGRLWEPNEIARGAAMAVVNQAFVRRYFPGEDILGHSVRMPRLTSEPPYQLAAAGSDGWCQIIGVTGDAVDDGLSKPILPGIYLPYSINMFMGTQILVRTQGDPLDMLPSIRRQIAAVNPDQQVYSQVDDLETWIAREPTWARSRLVSILFAGFSGLALILAAVGLYSVVSYSVVQRTSEFGIRMALGARSFDVLRVVLLSAGTSVGLGLAVGIALSLGVSRLLTRWVENATHNPFIVVGVSLLVIVVAALACLVPARRALSVDPMKALRCE